MIVDFAEGGFTTKYKISFYFSFKSFWKFFFLGGGGS